MAVDFKKTLKHLYAPKTKPSIVNIENANYIAVRGSGDPNDENRFHHEIYISDVRKTAPEKVKTVIRHPIKKKS